MKFHWWWILAAAAAIWFVGWFVTVIIAVFFNPLDSQKDSQKHFPQRLLGHCILNLFIWPQMLSALTHRRKFFRYIRTGKKPGWLVCGDGESNSREWKLSDGTQFSASASTSGELSDPADLSADYEDKSLAADVQYCVRMIAPTSRPPTEWASLKFTPRGKPPDPENEEDAHDYEGDRYQASVKLDRGKYEVAFRVPNRAGKIEECSGVILIVYDHDDYVV